LRCTGLGLQCLAEQGRNISCANGPGPHLQGKPTSMENPRRTSRGPWPCILRAAATVRFVHLVGARTNCSCVHTRVAPWLPENGTIQPSRHPSWHHGCRGPSSPRAQVSSGTFPVSLRARHSSLFSKVWSDYCEVGGYPRLHLPQSLTPTSRFGAKVRSGLSSKFTLI
jgi:hypothetical protein